MLGQAFGNVLARVVTTDHPDLVSAAVLDASEASKVVADVSETPFIAGDLSRPEAERLEALQKALFAPGHDVRSWLTGRYPATLQMVHEAAQAAA